MAIVKIKVIPRASKRNIIKEWDSLKIKLVSAPQDGKANKELREFLAKRLKVPKKSIEIISGEHSRDKRVSIPDLSLNEIKKRLG